MLLEILGSLTTNGVATINMKNEARPLPYTSYNNELKVD